MKGASGAQIRMDGDWVEKTCRDAEHQVEWFKKADRLGLTPWINLPKVELVTPFKYRIEFIEGHEATKDISLRALKSVFSQIQLWSQTSTDTSRTWDNYLLRLEQHVQSGDSPEMRKALNIIVDAPAPPQTFCHGDLTLENVIVPNARDDIFLIDPNFKPGLFQSYILDYGKILQSTFVDYHHVFNSHPGVSLTRHNSWVVKQLKKRDVWRESLIACLSHVVRFRQYRPPQERKQVDDVLSSLILNIK